MNAPDHGATVRQAPSVFILVAISMVAPAGINIIAPSMPAFVDVFDTDYATVQLTLSLFLVSIAFAQLVIGPVSDYFGRRPVVLCGMIVSIIGSIICLMAPNIWVFIAGRLLQGMGACTGIVLARAIIRDLYRREKAASMIGYVTMAMTVSPMVVPYIGGLLQEEVAWWGSSAFMLIFAAVVWGGSYFNLYETNQHLGRVTTVRVLWVDYVSLLKNKEFLRFSTVGAFASCVYFSFMGGAPLISHAVLGMSPTGYGLYFIFIAFGYGFGNFLSGRFAEAKGVIFMIGTGCFLSLVGVTLMALSFALGFTHPFALFGTMFFASVANGVTLPSAIAGAISARPQIAGAASGFTGFMQIGFGAIAATITAAWLDSNLSIWPMVTVMGITSVFSLLIAFTIRKSSRAAV